MGFNSGFKGLMKLDFSQQIFEKYSKIKCQEAASSGSCAVPRGRTGGRRDRHDEANSLFRNFANAAKNRPFTPLSKIRGFNQLANMLSESEVSKPVIS